LSARVTQDSVLWTVRTELRLAIPGGVTDDGSPTAEETKSLRTHVLSLSRYIISEVVKKVTVEAEWIAVLRQVRSNASLAGL